MKRILLTIFVVLAASLGAQPSPSRTDGIVVVRNITVKGNRLLPTVFWETIQDALKESGVDLRTEWKTTPDKLAEIVSRADGVIQQVYEKAGSAVLVTHEIEVLPPMNRYVEIRFAVVPRSTAETK